MTRPTLIVIALVLSLAPFARAADDFDVRDGIPNSQYFLANDRVGNQYLFFLGNSVLNGTGLKDQGLRYSFRMTHALKKHYPDASPRETRHMQPGGSWFGLYRVSKGQAVFGEVIASGHLAILDFAADDRDVDPDLARLRVEGLVRQIYRYRPTHSQIILYTLTPQMLADYKAGKTPEYIEVCEQIAEHYGIPSLNLAKVAADAIIAGKITFEEFSADGINPTDAGAKIYADAVERFVDALIAANPVPDKPANKKLPAPLFEATHDNGRIVAYEDPVVKLTGDWRPGQESPIGPFRHVLVSERSGNTLSMKFKGSEIGLIDVVGPDTPAIAYAVDGGPFKTLPAPTGVTEPTMRTVSLADGLDRDVEHEIVLQPGASKPVRIGGLLLNGTVEDPYAGLDRLAWIDAIYKTMDPVKYTPPADRFANIPQTMKKLREGGELRMVLLGDSIMGNTSGSSFELLLMRRYPNCKINKIASLRSSTGCNWYQHENRVEPYVLDKKPDLLVIGGISNGQDAEVVRSVIRQVRAKQPNVEVLLLTPVFGALSDQHIARFTREIDTTEPNFRWGMQKVAAEEKCAFFDMTGPWWQYIQDSGKTPGWYMGDRVHANARGCQIIGRLLEAWFTE